MQVLNIAQYEQWIQNPNINPITNKKIKLTGKIYRSYHQLNIQDLYIYECINEKDPISLNIFWTEENGKRIIVYKNLDNIIFYKDKNNKIRGLEKETIELMKGYKMTQDPVTKEELPLDIFNDITPKLQINEEDKSAYDLAFDVFQLLSNMSVFIDFTLFLELDKIKLLQFYYEIKDLYSKNLNKETKLLINKLFKLTKNEVEKLNINNIQTYLLSNIKKVLEVNNNLLSYILVGALSLVIPIIKELYPQYCFI
jgi:hypothetical protein